MENNKDVIEHIYKHCQTINDAIRCFGNSYESFCENVHYRNDVSMCLLQIGELAKHLSDDFIDFTKNEIPWKQIRCMRNMFAHAYGSMKIDEIWTTIIEDIPILVDFCNRQLEIARLQNETVNYETDEPEDDMDFEM